MKLIYGQPLPFDYYSTYCMSNGSRSPFLHFEKKYGYYPKYIAIAKDVDIKVPKGIRRTNKILVQPGHIKLR